MNKNKETGLQKYSLESVLKDEELRQHLPENLVTNGVAMILKKNISVVDNGNNDTYTMKIKFKIVPGEGLAESTDNAGAAESVSDVNASDNILIKNSSRNIGGFTDITKYLTENYKPILFNIDSKIEMNKKGQSYILELPSEVLNRPDLQSGRSGLSLSDFKTYWSINPKTGIEILLWPKNNHAMLGESELAYVKSQFKNNMDMEYDNGLKMPNLKIKTGIKTVQVALKAENSPYIHIFIDKENIKDPDGYENAKPYSKQIKKNNLIGASNDDLSRVVQFASPLVHYSPLSTFTVNTTKKVTALGVLYPPADLVKAIIGEESYAKFGKGSAVDDLVLWYNHTDNDFDMIITTKENIKLLRQDMVTFEKLMNKYSIEEETYVKGFGAGVMSMPLPKFVRLPETTIQFSANNSPYIEVKKVPTTTI